MSALGHPVRLQIVEKLLADQCCVGSLVECFDLPQPLVSRHLAVLREAGVVAVERKGRQREYRVVHRSVPALMRCLERSWSSSGTAEE
jgi:ArsR family transcriptional regulator